MLSRPLSPSPLAILLFVPSLPCSISIRHPHPSPRCPPSLCSILQADRHISFLPLTTLSCFSLSEPRVTALVSTSARSWRHSADTRTMRERAQSSVPTSSRDATLAATPAECWLVGESVVRRSFDATTRRTSTCAFQPNLSKTTWPWRLRLDRPYLTDSQSRPSPRRPATSPTRLARAAARPAGRHAAKGRFDCSGEERESSKMARF